MRDAVGMRGIAQRTGVEAGRSGRSVRPGIIGILALALSSQACAVESIARPGDSDLAGRAAGTTAALRDQRDAYASTYRIAPASSNWDERVFSDVPQTCEMRDIAKNGVKTWAWACEALELARREGWVGGFDVGGKLLARPWRMVTRAELAHMVYAGLFRPAELKKRPVEEVQAAERRLLDNCQLDDLPEGSAAAWARPFACALAPTLQEEVGRHGGELDPNVFQPHRLVTLGGFAASVVTLLKKTETNIVSREHLKLAQRVIPTQLEQINASPERDSIRALAESNCFMLEGNPHNVDPLRTVTRQEAVATLACIRHQVGLSTSVPPPIAHHTLDRYQRGDRFTSDRQWEDSLEFFKDSYLLGRATRIGGISPDELRRGAGTLSPDAVRWEWDRFDFDQVRAPLGEGLTGRASRIGTGAQTVERRVELAYLTVEPPRGLAKANVVIVNGSTENILKWSMTIYDLMAEGYSIYTMDHRSQGYSDRPLVSPGHPDASVTPRGKSARNNVYEYQKNDVAHFNFYTDDLHLFIRDVVRAKGRGGRLLALCHSMGGGICTRYLQRYQAGAAPPASLVPIGKDDRGRAQFEEVESLVGNSKVEREHAFDAAFLSAPMHGIEPGGIFAEAAFKLGVVPKARNIRNELGADSVFAQAYMGASLEGAFGNLWTPETFEENKTTGSPIGFHLSQDPRVDQPFKRVGHPTRNWIATATDATGLMLATERPSERAHTKTQTGPDRPISVPFVIRQAKSDAFVKNREQKKLCERSDKCTLQVSQGSMHEAFIEQEAIRHDFLNAVVAFFSNPSRR